MPSGGGTVQDGTFLLGTYNDDGTHDPGIYRFRLDEDGSVHSLGRVAEANNPSFLAYTPDRAHLLAVEELGGERRGNVVAFTVAGDSLTNPQRQPVSGAGPCHINANNDGYVTVATYAGGTLELFQLEEGRLSPRLDVQDHRQRGAEEPHAHSSYFVGGGKSVIAADKGTDEVWYYSIDGQALAPASPPTIKLTDGAGPRHIALHQNGNWAYVINELNGTISWLDLETMTVRQSWSTLPDDYTGENYCADIHLSADGRFLYGSNRGHNSIVVYEVMQDGSLNYIEHESVAGDWPRNFALSPDERYLFVANQRSKNITTLSRDAETGELEYVSSAEAPTPTCILF